MAKVKYKVPTGYQEVTAYLRCADASAAIEFYKSAFGAKERYRLTMGPRVGHAELDFGKTRVMLSDEFPEVGARGPKAIGGACVAFSLYVADADAVFQQAIVAGAKVKRPLTDEFYGDRTGQLEDPFGHIWSIQQRLEDVSPREMQKRLDAMMTQGETGAARKPEKSRSKSKSKG